MNDARSSRREVHSVSDTLADAEHEIEHLHRGMHSRTLIGQAQGILMERLGVDAEQAIDYLRRVSSHSNRKLLDIAKDIAETRKLPTLD
ncbi:ANTAR domain-containing protein [Nocardioides renjunii]|uniref:ANTAR domain-containing protein n=1 Tax=Nocardioides renjunii TaxID=3095075 RepID=UPI002AFFE83F|nr:ANTAR domain-containing protein [Nocardioides sp. S-34]WQQ21404.1 ANTAR domain-containing protein [Nocardioides sp. S-34]